MNRTLLEPFPDLVAYRSTFYRGMLKNPMRMKNYILFQNEKFAEVMNALPVKMDVEPISHCNFRCVMCQVSGWEGGKRASNMTFDELRSLIENQYGVCEVKFQGFGEPLMHKDYIDMIRFLVEKDIWVRTTVNGSLLHFKDNYRRLIDSGIGDVNISVDGATKEVFEGIRRRSDFDLVTSNLKLLNDYCEKQGKKNTMMWVVVQKANRHQIFDFVELARKLNFKRLTFSVGLSDWGQNEWSENNSKLQSDRLSTEEIDRLIELSHKYGLAISVWDLQAKYKTDLKKNLCHWPFKWTFVGSDSKATPCCMIGNPDVVGLGDTKDFLSTWNGPLYREFRKQHLEGNIPTACKTCYINKSPV